MFGAYRTGIGDSPGDDDVCAFFEAFDNLPRAKIRICADDRFVALLEQIEAMVCDRDGTVFGIEMWW